MQTARERQIYVYNGVHTLIGCLKNIIMLAVYMEIKFIYMRGGGGREAEVVLPGDFFSLYTTQQTFLAVMGTNFVFSYPGGSHIECKCVDLIYIGVFIYVQRKISKKFDAAS